MKNLIFALTLLLILPGLTACGKKDNKRTPITNRQARNQVGTTGGGSGSGGEDPQTSAAGTRVSNNGYIYGQIYYSNLNTFDQNVRGFVSATIDPWSNPPELGTFSNSTGQSTGIWIRGDAYVQGGNFDPSGATARKLDLAKTSIRIMIWDSYAGKQDANGQVIPEYGVSFLGATSDSYIDYNSKTAVLSFMDSYGKVTFSGRFDNDWFSGKVTYENYTQVSSVEGANKGNWAGDLGEFYIATCGFFYCN